jgi:hypothetical protein
MSDADPAVELRSPLESQEHATDVGLVAGMTGRGILQAVLTLHWRDVLRATRARKRPGSQFRQAGSLPEGVHRPGE